MEQAISVDKAPDEPEEPRARSFTELSKGATTNSSFSENDNADNSEDNGSTSDSYPSVKNAAFWKLEQFHTDDEWRSKM
jgi:hypothetical protein